MDATDAVELLAEVVAPHEELGEAEIYAALARAGLPAADVDRTFKFTQIAWGRVFLAGMGIQFSDQFVCQDSRGKRLHSGLLSKQPHFAHATFIAHRFASSPGFSLVALASADVRAVNRALHAGADPAGLVASPAMIVLSSP